jgi:hypothetical protein
MVEFSMQLARVKVFDELLQQARGSAQGNQQQCNQIFIPQKLIQFQGI